MSYETEDWAKDWGSDYPIEWVDASRIIDAHPWWWYQRDALKGTIVGRYIQNDIEHTQRLMRKYGY